MPRKKPARRKVKSSQSRPFLIYRKYVILIPVFLFVVGAYFTSQTQTFYFQTSTKEKVDFASSTGEYDASAEVAQFHNQVMPVPKSVVHTAKKESSTEVLGDSTSNKRIEVDLTNQRLYAIENGNRVYDFPISSGKPWWATPTGTFRIWVKLRYTRMQGGSQALGTYYNLPNVPYTMFFYNDQVPKWKGYGIHGAYWHNNFGQPMSHGCINMKEEDVAQIYYWANPELKGKQSIYADAQNPGTEVVIYGTTPSS